MKLIAAVFSVAVAFPDYADKMPNGNNIASDPAIGHFDSLGVAGENDFGKDYRKYNAQWLGGYCRDDSDGDGFTNGQELGDPCCTWTDGSQPLATDGLSHPGKDDGEKPTYPEVNMDCDAGTGTPPAGGTQPPTSINPGTGGNSLLLNDDEDDSDEIQSSSEKQVLSLVAGLTIVYMLL